MWTTPTDLAKFLIEVQKTLGHGDSNWGFQCSMTAHRLKGYGVVMMTNGDNGPALMQELRNRIQQAYPWDVLDKPNPRTYGPVK